MGGIIFKYWKRKINNIPRGKKNLIMEVVQAGSFVNKHYWYCQSGLGLENS